MESIVLINHEVITTTNLKKFSDELRANTQFLAYAINENMHTGIAGDSFEYRGI